MAGVGNGGGKGVGKDDAQGMAAMGRANRDLAFAVVVSHVREIQVEVAEARAVAAEARAVAAEARADVLNAAVNRYIDRGIDATDTLQEVRAGMRTFEADQDIGQEIRALTLTNPAVARLWTEFLLTYNGIVEAEGLLNGDDDEDAL